jgi:hypothetical protein
MTGSITSAAATRQARADGIKTTLSYAGMGACCCCKQCYHVTVPRRSRTVSAGWMWLMHYRMRCAFDCGAHSFAEWGMLCTAT